MVRGELGMEIEVKGARCGIYEMFGNWGLVSLKGHLLFMPIPLKVARFICAKLIFCPKFTEYYLHPLQGRII